MTAARRLPSWVRPLAISLMLAVAVVALARLPWLPMLQQIRGADARLLVLAAGLQLAGLAAKGWSWYLLLRPVACLRWRHAQQATLIGAAVNALSVSVAGEAARIQSIRKLEHVPLGQAVASVAWQRAIEAIGLAIFLLVVPFLLPLPGPLRRFQIGAAVLLGLVLVLSGLRGWWRIVERVPYVDRAVERLAEIRAAARLAGPLALALVNWTALWLSLHLTLRAVGVLTPFAASFAAMMAAEVAGIPRLTPANVGVMQAAIVLALLPFGVPPPQAIAAGIALQGVQVLPVFALTALLGGWKAARSRSMLDRIPASGLREGDRGARREARPRRRDVG
jgi:uncharacterized membrane protein YbhN (UPF0104 family)